MRKRRSLREFTDEEIPYAEVERLIDYGTWAPSSCNRQLWNFIVLHKSQLRRRPDIFQHLLRINANWAIFVTYHRVYNSQFYANIQSASAAIMNIVLAATDLGIGSIWMAERGNEGKIRKELDIPESQLLVATVCLGQRTKSIIFDPQRRPLGQVVHRGKYREKHLFPDHTDSRKWTTKQIVNYVDYAMRAKSPSKLFYLAIQKREYEKLLSSIPTLGRETLMAYDFSGELSTDLLQRKKVGRLTIHSLSPAMRDFIKERLINEGIDLSKVTFVQGDLLKSRWRRRFDNIVIFKRLEKLPEPEKAFDALIRKCSGKGTRIILIVENKYNLQRLVKKLFRLIRALRPRPFRSFQRIEPVGLFGPFRPFTPSEVKRLVSRKDVEIVSDFGVDPLPGIQANAGPPFWGAKVIPSTRFEEATTTSFLKNLYRTRMLELRVR